MRTLIVLFTLLMALSGPAMGQIHVENGQLSQQEKRLIVGLRQRMIPLPDTIRIRASAEWFGKYDMFEEEIYLYAGRFPNPNTVDQPPSYTFSEKEADPSVPRVHFLAHEIAHHVQNRLNVPNSLRIMNHETEADVIAAAFQKIVFGTEPEQLGFTEQWQEKANEYIGIIGDTWRIKYDSCYRK